MIKHSSQTKSKSSYSKILIIGVSEEFSQNFSQMYAGLTKSSRKRIFSEASQWF